MRMFELSEFPARAAALALVATDAGYGKLGRCGPITSNSRAEKSGEITEILSVGARLGVRERRGARISVPLGLTVHSLRLPSFLGWRELQRQLVDELDESFALIDGKQVLKSFSSGSPCATAIVRTSISRIWSSNNTRHSRPFFVDSSGNFTLLGGVDPVVAFVVDALTELVVVDVVLRFGMAMWLI